MQSSHAPDYLDVADFTTAHCHEPNESTQCSQSQTPDSDNFCDREIQLIHTEVVALTSLEAMVERGLRAFWERGQISSAPSGRVTSTYVAQVAKEYQQKSDEDTCSETGSAAGSSTPAVPQGDTVIAQTGSNEVRAYWRCCWDIEVSVSEVSKYKVTANTEALLNFQNKLLLLEEVHGI